MENLHKDDNDSDQDGQGKLQTGIGGTYRGCRKPFAFPSRVVSPPYIRYDINPPPHSPGPPVPVEMYN